MKKIFAIIAITGLLLLQFSCDKKTNNSIKVGFLGTLSGHNSTIGDYCRDSALLAVEQMNQAGGINGRQIELIVKDIRNDVSVGKEVVNELLRENVIAIIGPMFSSMAVALSPVVENKRTIMISPTAGTTLLSGKDDYLLRLYPGSDVTTNNLAKYLNSKSISKVAIVRDEDNSDFTRNWEELFTQNFKSLGGEIIYSDSFLSERDSFFQTVAKDKILNSEAILVLAPPLETALICQQLSKLKTESAIFVSEWSVANELISGGGKAVEGVTFFHAINISSQGQKYLDFKKAYQGRFNSEPTFPAVLAYDAAKTIFRGIELGAKDGAELKEILLQQESIELMQTTIRFDRFGDVERDFFLTTVHNGEFTTLGQ